jgi:glycine/D-amino acid oxidase-like deaminating enzyme
MNPRFPHSYFSLGYGGNGITFSALAAEIITSLIKYKKHSCEQLFSFNR